MSPPGRAAAPRKRGATGSGWRANDQTRSYPAGVTVKMLSRSPVLGYLASREPEDPERWSWPWSERRWLR